MQYIFVHLLLYRVSVFFHVCRAFNDKKTTLTPKEKLPLV